MTTLTDQVFKGTWGSYKTFLSKGEVKQHTISNYEEFDFNEDRVLTITNYRDGRGTIIKKTDQWMIELYHKKHFLKLDKDSPFYEVITVNHTTLVLLNATTNNKTFFVPHPVWEQYVKTNPIHVL